MSELSGMEDPGEAFADPNTSREAGARVAFASNATVPSLLLFAVREIPSGIDEDDGPSRWRFAQSANVLRGTNLPTTGSDPVTPEIGQRDEGDIDGWI
jgi:hypothetical protein